MTVLLNDKEIANPVRERKELPADYRRRTQVRSRRGHREQGLEFEIGTSTARLAETTH